ncbi:MAG: type 4b pilus protein PilO2, partial [Bdellovibrionales bacterium]
MAAGVITLGRYHYVVGLYWENSPGNGRVSQIAKEAARQPGQQADFYVIRPGSRDGRVPQFGLCSSEGGVVQPGMPVLAACLANQVPGSWAGAFRFGEGVAVVIVRDDLIVPDGDLFFHEESEARDRLIQEIGFGGLQTIYAPEGWSIPGADSIPLTLLLNDRADILLQQVSFPQKTKIFIAAGVVAAIAVIGVLWQVQKKNAEQEMLAMEALRRAQEAAAMPSLVKQLPPEPKYERLWESAPAPMDVINACREGLSLIPSDVAGWTLASLSCNGSSISLSWNRARGETAPPMGALVNDTGRTATKSVPLPPLKPRGTEALKNIGEITNRYLLQNWPGSVSRAPDDPLP